MRAVTGALLVVAGAILWGAGSIALTMSYGISGYHADPGGWATFIGLVLLPPPHYQQHVGRALALLSQ